MRQFAGQLDGAGGVKPVLDQPVEQGRHVDLGPSGQAAGLLADRGAPRHRLLDGLDAGDDDPRAAALRRVA